MIFKGGTGVSVWVGSGEGVAVAVSSILVAVADGRVVILIRVGVRVGTGWLVEITDEKGVWVPEGLDTISGAEANWHPHRKKINSRKARRCLDCLLGVVYSCSFNKVTPVPDF